MSAALVLLAGGSGSRMGAASRDRNKVYLPLAGRRVLTWSIESAVRSGVFDRLVVVSRPDDEADLGALLRREARVARHLRLDVVSGGASRHESEMAALRLLAPEIESGEVDVIAIHDGARPLTGPALFRQVVTTARSRGGAVPCLPADAVLPIDGDAPVRDDAGRLAHTELVRVQTPQAFRAQPLLSAYRASEADGFLGDDTADSVVRYSDCAVVTVPGSRRNLKVTYAQDLFLAERLLAAAGFELP